MQVESYTESSQQNFLHYSHPALCSHLSQKTHEIIFRMAAKETFYCTQETAALQLISLQAESI